MQRQTTCIALQREMSVKTLAMGTIPKSVMDDLANDAGSNRMKTPYALISAECAMPAGCTARKN